MKRVYCLVLLVIVSFVGFTQSVTYDQINFVDPSLGSNGDNVRIYRDDDASDHARLWIKLGDEYKADFNIGYRRYQDQNWVQLFSLNGYGDGFFPGKLGIGTTSSPFQKLSVIDGAIFLGNKTVNKFESGRIRFSEYENSFQGAFIHYDGSNNVFNIGVHQQHDTDAIGDDNSISIQRATGFVGIGTNAPSEKFEVKGNQKISGSLSMAKSSSTDIQFASDGTGAAHALFFNAYKGTDNGWIANSTHYSNNVGSHRNGAGGIVFYGNGGSLDFLISEESEGVGQQVDWGSTKMRIKRDGKVGIGTTNPDEKLTVNGTIHSTEVKVDLTVPGPDYVFEPNYDLRTLKETEEFIKANKHLPEIPSAKEMEANGVELGVMNMLLLKKIEELTLYLIEMKEENVEMKSRLETLENSKK